MQRVGRNAPNKLRIILSLLGAPDDRRPARENVYTRRAARPVRVPTRAR